MNDRSRKELISNAQNFILWSILGLIDSSFLIIWVLTQWMTAKVISYLSIDGIDAAVFFVFQVLFAVSTLFPVVLYIFENNYKLWLQTKKRMLIEKEKTLNE